MLLQVILSSETSVFWRNIYIFVSDAAMFFQKYITTLLEYLFVQTFSTIFKFVLGNIIAAINFVT